MALHPDRPHGSGPASAPEVPARSRDRAIGGPAPHPAGFARADHGSIGILFAFLLLPLLIISGAAVDYGFATRLETKLQAATDATVLLLCQTPLTTTNADLNALAVATVTGQMGTDGVVVEPLTITADPRRILLKTQASSPVFFGGITGTRMITPGAQAQCATPMPKTFEIALVLDNTGSMSKAGNDGVTKLASLKSAAQKFVSYVLTNPNFAPGTKIAIVPFSSAVAVDTTYSHAAWVDTEGRSPSHWTNFSGMSDAGFKSRFDVFSKLAAAEWSWKWAGCFESQPYPQNVTDMATNGDASLYIPYLAPDEGGPGTRASYYASWNNSYSLNSYIDDDDGTDNGACPKLPSDTPYPKAQARGCKYKNPRNVQTGNLAEGVPKGPNFGCTTQPLQRLTRHSVILSTLIDKLVASGSTNIHEGLIWGWRTISPKSVFADGSAYGDAKVGKVIVLMTDGANTWGENGWSYNRSLVSSNGYFRNADGSNADSHFPPANQGISTSDAARKGLDALTRLACENAKASPANIAIYTIGFSVSSDPIDAQGIQLLKDCASSPSQYFLANDANSLIAAFNQIGASIGRLRLTQ